MIRAYSARIWAGCEAATKKRSRGDQSFGSGAEHASFAGEIESAEGLLDQHGPAARADDPGNGHAPAVGGKVIAALAAEHGVR